MTVDKRSALASTLLIIALAASSGCDSGERDQNQFDDVGPGTLVAEARSFAWSSDGERLYFTTDAPVEPGGGRYQIYEVSIGGSPQLLYEGQTETYDERCALVRHMEEVDGYLYFYTDFYSNMGTFGNIYRLSPGANDEPTLIVEDAASPSGGGTGPGFDVSADGRRIAHFSRSEEAVWATVRSLGTGEPITSVGGATRRFDARLRVFLSDDGAHLLHNADFDYNSASPEDFYSVVDLTTGTAQSVPLRLNEDIEGIPRTNSYSIYAEGGTFTAVYAVGHFSTPFSLVSHRLPGAPQVVASIAESADGLFDTFHVPDASDSYYAFWREPRNLGAGPRALHVIDLEDGTERRVAGPMPVSVAPCTTRLRIDPGDSQVAYLGVASEGADVGLYVAPLRP